MNGFSTSTMVFIDCANCGMIFGVTRDFEDRRRRDHQSFFCPKGHSNYYAERTEEDKLRDRLTREQAAHDQTRANRDTWQRASVRQEHKARAYKGIAKHYRRRIHAGVCPHCNRSFENVARHMKTKHAKRAKR